MRIALFDYMVVPTNPLGSCHRRILKGLCREHEFTVFAVRFDNPCPERIRFIRVPAPLRPLALLFATFHLLAPFCFWLDRLRHGTAYDLVQSIESNPWFGQVVDAHFCHRVFLRNYWPQVRTRGLRGWLRWLDHWLHALLEPRAYRRAAWVVTPSRGLARELAQEWPALERKLVIIPNPVDLDRLRAPPEFDRAGTREGLGFEPGHVVLVFAALGHFERKGLPLLLTALANVRDARARLVVVGGESDLVAKYRRVTRSLGLGDRVCWVGMQRDVRPYLWAADAFAFPSFYETFSLVCFEAAASGLPLIVPPLHGVEEIVRDGENGFVIERSADGVAAGIGRFLQLAPEERLAMGRRATLAVSSHTEDSFIAAWRAFYGATRVG